MPDKDRLLHGLLRSLYDGSFLKEVTDRLGEFGPEQSQGFLSILSALHVSAADNLCSFLSEVQNEFIRNSGMNILRSLTKERPKLLEPYMVHEDAGFVRDLIEILVSIDSPAAQEIASKALRHSDRDIRLKVLGLIEPKYKIFLKPLLELIEEEDEKIRDRCLRMLARKRDPDVANRLIKTIYKIQVSGGKNIKNLLITLGKCATEENVPQVERLFTGMRLDPKILCPMLIMMENPRAQELYDTYCVEKRGLLEKMKKWLLG